VGDIWVFPCKELKGFRRTHLELADIGKQVCKELDLIHLKQNEVINMMGTYEKLSYYGLFFKIKKGKEFYIKLNQGE